MTRLHLWRQDVVGEIALVPEVAANISVQRGRIGTVDRGMERVVVHLVVVPVIQRAIEAQVEPDDHQLPAPNQLCREREQSIRRLARST
jgi:hypothetical protein